MVALFSVAAINCQQLHTSTTVGLLYSEPEKVSEGVLLYAPLYSKNVFLINNCGALVKQWQFDAHSNYSGALLLEDGSVIKLVLSEKDGAGVRKDACIEKRSWDNSLLWKFCGEGRYSALHSDFYVLPNGNVLALLKDRHTIVEAINAGVEPENLVGNTFDLESVVEIRPTGTSTGEIAWEWHLWDHLIQSYDQTKSNYGDISLHPRRLDANILESNVHFNSIDYNIKLNQIILSNWSDHEIYIIEHSQTSEIAASSAGGKYGYGGDFLFRWGNEGNYNVGIQTLFGQHNPLWIPTNYSRFGGMISIFNNEYGHYRDDELKSTVVILDIDPDGDGVYDFLEKNTFKPTSYEYMWMGKIYDNWMLSRIMSGVEVQSNGNLLVCEATKGRFSEIDTAGNVVWVYKCPDEGTEKAVSNSRGIIEQGDIANSQVYKVKKYPLDYRPLKNIGLCNKEPIENTNEVTRECINSKKPKVLFKVKEKRGKLVAFEANVSKTDSINWNFNDGQTSNETKLIHQFQNPGFYYVCLTGYNCFDSTKICNFVEINEYITTGISETEKTSLSITPNLVKAYFKIVNTGNDYNYKASIYDVFGKLIMQDLNINQLIDVNHLKNGVYFLGLRVDSDLNSQMLKFIKID